MDMVASAIQPSHDGTPQPRELKAGERLEAVVTGLAHYGAFVVTREGHRGLVHISEVSDRYVSDVRDYFTVGETITVEVVGRQEGTGRYAFSTRRVGGKQPLRPPHARSPRAGTGARGWPARPAGLERVRPGRDEDLICAFLGRRVGAVSEEVRQQLRELIARHGGVRVALAVAEAGRRFDTAAALLNWVGRQLGQRRHERGRRGVPAAAEVRSRPAGL